MTGGEADMDRWQAAWIDLASGGRSGSDRIEEEERTNLSYLTD